MSLESYITLTMRTVDLDQPFVVWTYSDPTFKRVALSLGYALLREGEAVPLTPEHAGRLVFDPVYPPLRVHHSELQLDDHDAEFLSEDPDLLIVVRLSALSAGEPAAGVQVLWTASEALSQWRAE